LSQGKADDRVIETFQTNSLKELYLLGCSGSM
jgi:hypothetical protein